jgi:hypothetical protein
MRSIRFYLLGVLILRFAYAQAPAAIQISGAVTQPFSITAEDLSRMPLATVRTTSKGVETIYEGVFVYELLKRAGAPQGSEMRGKALTTYVLAEAKDGYRVIFSLGELDPYFTDNQVLVADKADGRPLDDKQGPFKLITPKDKSGPRTIRMLTKLELVTIAK